MIYNDCPLYGLSSKKMLCYLLGIKDKKLLKQENVAKMVIPYIDTTEKSRLIEAPLTELKTIQKRMKTLLGKIVVPENIFSGIKGRSYADNASYHIGDKPKYLYKLDLTAFFPSISRNTVYSFFRDDLCCSPDIANILTNFTTIDLAESSSRNIESIYQFLTEKNVLAFNHLITGAPTSQILSYLVNHKMFDELQVFANRNSFTMTVYVDDIFFSSERMITRKHQEIICSIITKYNYQISTHKVKCYSKKYPKLITGVIINSEGKLAIKNSLQKNIITEHNNLRNNPEDIKCRQRLMGLVTAARQVKKNAFPTIYKFAFKNVAAAKNKKSK